MLTDFTHLNNSVSRYLKYAKDIDIEKIKINGFPINFNRNYSDTNIIDNIFNKILPNLARLISLLPEPIKENKLIFYSLQNSFLNSQISEVEGTPRGYWNNVTKTEFSIKESLEDNEVTIKDKIYFFLYYSNESDEKSCDEFYKNQNSTDEQFCHSMLLRDFLRHHKLGTEIDLSNKLFEKDSEDKDEISEYLGEKFSFLTDEEKDCEGKKEDKNKFKVPISSIIESFNTYFKLDNCKKLKSDVYLKYITDFYAFNQNINAFKDVSDLILNDVQLSNIKSGHDIYSSLLEGVKDNSVKLADISKWLVYINFLSDLTKLLVYFETPTNEKPIKILLLDDNLDDTFGKIQKIESEIDFINYWLGNEAVNIDGELKRIKKINEFFRVFDENKIKKIKEYDFILMDLDFGGELKGFDYLKKLRENTELFEKPFVIVFSRNEDPESIQKALNMGALIYATKQNVAKLVLEISKVIPLVNKINDINNKIKEEKEEKISLGDNWNLLYQLPLTKILDLKTSKICGGKYHHYSNEDEEAGKGVDNYGFDNKELKYDKEYLWIKKLPKAELHNHIGSVLGPELIPKTALVVLSKWYNKTKEENKDTDKVIKLIINFLEPIVTDPYLWDTKNACHSFSEYFLSKEDIEWFRLKQLFATDEASQFYDQSIFTIISDSLNLKGLIKSPEEVLLSPQDETIEKHFKPFSRIQSSKYFRQKIELRQNDINYEVIILFFILLLIIKQNSKQKYSEFLNRIKEQILDVLDKAKEQDKSLVFNENNNKEKFLNGINNFINKLSEEIDNQKIIFDSKESDKYLLKKLISAHSIERCLKYENRGLFNYLRGCEYGGSPHLQCEESINLVAHHIIHNYAIPDNIRYLDLRCQVDGYNKLKLFDKTDDDAYPKIVKSLKSAFTYFQQEANKNGNKVHINLIVTAKRHKTLKEFENNVKITLDDLSNEKKNKNIKEENNSKSFFESNETKIVSFDIAGLEKGFRLNSFKDQIKPLLDKCVPITMHAGEEDSHEAIWEAVYLGHAQRLGHALTLKDNENLLKFVRESFVNIELCPISNYLTNNKFQFNKEGVIENYPLKRYLKERLSVSINTDNPYVSNTTLSKEFLFASKICGGLTKWQLLKIILYSFKSITIDKHMKTKLMKEIDEEIFKILLNE